MKKRTLGLIGCMLFASLALGFAVGMTVNKAYDNQIVAVYAEGESEEQPVEPAEETQEGETIADKVNNFKDTYLVPLLSGVSVTAVLSFAVSIVFAILNHKKIKEGRDDIGNATIVVNDCRGIVDSTSKLAKDLKEQYNITDKNYNAVIEKLDQTSSGLEQTEQLLKKVMDENAVLSKENAELKDIVLTMVTHSKEYVSNGVAEQLAKKYLNK